MDVLGFIITLLFAAFWVGTILRILGMLERQRAGDDIERARLVFFFTGCLMLVCLVPLQLFELLGSAALVGNLAVVVTNFIGYALTYDWRRSGGKKSTAAAGEKQTVRAYHVYYKGQAYGLCTKAGIDLLLAHKLLKRRRTVELVDDFKRQARLANVEITLLQSRDGKQRLIKVVGEPPVSSGTAGEID